MVRHHEPHDCLLPYTLHPSLGTFDFWHRAELPADEDISNLKPQSILQHKPFLQVVSVFGILDPPRPEAIEAVKLAHKAGIVVKMITGGLALAAICFVGTACKAVWPLISMIEVS